MSVFRLLIRLENIIEIIEYSPHCGYMDYVVYPINLFEVEVHEDKTVLA